jgi:DNA-binding protein HU-beta
VPLARLGSEGNQQKDGHKPGGVFRPLSGRLFAAPRTKLRGGGMNKTEIIDHIAKSADISKAAASRALEAAVTAIKTAMKRGGMVTLVGFGTFYVGKRAARAGRNPRTGDTIKIKAARVPKFRAGKALKDAVN